MNTVTFHERAERNKARAGFLDLERPFLELARAVAPFTMTTTERMYAMWCAVRHVVDAGVPGAIAECGVWKGGSMMIAAAALKSLDAERELLLFDVFGAPPAPAPSERDVFGRSCLEGYEAHQDARGVYIGEQVSEREVMENMVYAGAPRARLVKGRVEDTLPIEAPQELAVLRLDVDWKVPTLHCLEHLWPRLMVGGVLILDDYGHLSGAREAADEFFAGLPARHRPLLSRIDYSGRLAVKGPLF